MATDINQSLNPQPPIIETEPLKPGSKKRTILMVIVVIVLVIALLLILNPNLLGGGEPTPTPTPSPVSSPVDNEEDNEEPEVTTTPEEESTVEVPDNWKQIELEGIDYKMYRPNSWFFRFFGSTLGIDPNEIPTQSEYAGMITMNKLNTTDPVQGYKDSLVGDVDEQTLNVNELEWTVLEGMTEANELFDSQQIKVGIVTVGSSHYALEYRVSPDSFSENEEVFDTLIRLITFN